MKSKNIFFCVCLALAYITNTWGKDNIKLSPHANIANSYILLNILRTEYCPDSLMAWINNGKQATIVCKVNLSGEIIDVISIRSKTRYPIVKDRIKFKRMLLKHKLHLFFPLEIVGDISRKKEIKRAKKNYRKQYKEKGYINIGIVCFDNNFNLHVKNIKEKMQDNNIVGTDEKILDMLLDYYRNNIIYY